MAHHRFADGCRIADADALTACRLPPVAPARAGARRIGVARAARMVAGALPESGGRVLTARRQSLFRARR